MKKRVAFPLSGVKASGGVDPTLAPDPVDLSKILAPPASSSTPPLPKISAVCSETAATAESLVDQLQHVLQRLRSVYDYNQNEEISKRLTIMENMWLDGKLDENVRRKVVDLSTGKVDTMGGHAIRAP